MVALRNGSFVLVCALGVVGCFLDEGPRVAATSDTKTSSQTSEPARSGAGRPGFVPRDPAVATGRTDMDAAEPQPSAQDDASAPAAMSDAAMKSPQSKQDAGATRAHVAHDAASPKPDAAARDAALPATRDAQVAQDAGPADAQVSKDAAVRMLPQPIHRYDFSGTGRVAVDLIGDADGQVLPGSYLDGSGSVEFTRSEDVGVELPSGLFAEATAFTIVGWMSVRTQDCWQRLFDFTFVDQRSGMGMGNGQQMTQASALFVTPYGCPDGFPLAGYVTEQTQYRVADDQKLAMPRNLMLGVMYDSSSRVLQLIVNGVVQQQGRVPINLRELNRARGGLGRSYHPDDKALNGSISEFRVYAQTLDAATLAEIAARGPDLL